MDRKTDEKVSIKVENNVIGKYEERLTNVSKKFENLEEQMLNVSVGEDSKFTFMSPREQIKLAIKNYLCKCADDPVLDRN